MRKGSGTGNDAPAAQAKEESHEPAEDAGSSERPVLDKARFTILVFKPEGRQTSGVPVRELRDYLGMYGGVSVYDAGFRLPYYGSQKFGGHDWLNVAADQGKRLIASQLLPDRLRIPGRYLLDLPNPGRLLGAVEVDTNYEHRVCRPQSEPRRLAAHPAGARPSCAQ